MLTAYSPFDNEISGCVDLLDHLYASGKETDHGRKLAAKTFKVKFAVDRPTLGTAEEARLASADQRDRPILRCRNG